MMQYYNTNTTTLVCFLVLDLAIENGPKQAGDGEPNRSRKACENRELLLPRFTLLFAVRKKINADHAGSNLRIASPQATISAGASIVSCRGFTLDERAMLANGFATTVCTCVL